MTTQEAKDQFGAQFYMPMKDGVTPQLYYKYETIQFNDGTSCEALVYLSFCNIWMGSSLIRLKGQEYTDQVLVPIKD